jgi:aspartate kinase
MIVMKFGGTSVQDASAMKNVLNIVQMNSKKSILLVLSACAGITNQLIDLVQNAPKRHLNESKAIIEQIQKRHSTIIYELIKSEQIQQQAIKAIGKLIKELLMLIEGINFLNECTDRSYAQTVAFGELLSTTIFHYAILDKNIKSKFVDARKILVTDENYLEGKVDYQLLKKKINSIKNLSKQGFIVVTQGFIASDYAGRTTTLGRGGSDYSAALFGSALIADEIQIWTDVSGVLTTDPRIIPSAVPIPEMTFQEIRELSFYGAKVLHPDTIKPAVENSIPVRILNTYKPKDKGTLILNKNKSGKPVLRSVILKKTCNEFIVEIPTTENSHIFFSNLLKRFESKNIKILYSASTENNCRIIIDGLSINEEERQYIFGAYKHRIEDCSLICLSGSNIEQFSQINNYNGLMEILTDINIKHLLFGISDVSLLILIKPKDGINLLNRIHEFVLKQLK